MKNYKLYGEDNNDLVFLYSLKNGKRRELTLFNLTVLEKDKFLFFYKNGFNKELNAQIDSFKRENKDRYEFNNYD